MLLLLFEKFQRQKGIEIHPLYRYEPEAKKIGIARSWKWGAQAMKAYLKIPKTGSYIPYEKEKEVYNPKRNTNSDD